MTDKDKNYGQNNPSDRNNNKSGGNKNNTDFATDVNVDTDKKNERK